MYIPLFNQKYVTYRFKTITSIRSVEKKYYGEL